MSSQFFKADGDGSCDTEQVECAAVLEGHVPSESIHSLAISHETGQLFSTGGDCTVRVWQMTEASVGILFKARGV